MGEDHSDNQYFAYFGFGSLVNRHTLSDDIVCTIPATLKGWRRHWQPRPNETMSSSAKSSIALLSIHEDPSCDIHGLIIVDKLSNLKALDLREMEYLKVGLPQSNFIIDNNHLASLSEVSIHAYVSPLVEPGNRNISLIRSYLDVVMLGYLREYGETGIREFMSSTKGFELPIIEDRKQPIYPRHQPVSDDETELFERILPNQYWRN